MTRLLSSFPALIVLVVVSALASVLWLVGAVATLFVARLPAFVADFLGDILRYQYRLAAYHLSIVDRYPSFGKVDVPSMSGSNLA